MRPCFQMFWSRIAESHGKPIFSFLRTSIVFFIVAVPFYNSAQGSDFSTSLPTCYFVSLCVRVCSSHVKESEAISHCSFDLYIPWLVIIEHHFTCLVAICTSSFEECLLKFFACLALLFWLSLRSSGCMLDINLCPVPVFVKSFTGTQAYPLTGILSIATFTF